MIEKLHAGPESYSRTELCRALGVSRSGLYDHGARAQRPRRLQDRELAKEIALLFSQSRCTYGARRLQQMLARQRIRCGRNRLRRLMRTLGLQAVQKRRFRPKTTQSVHHEPIAPNRLNQLPERPSGPNEVWCADLTYLPSQQDGWLYLAVELDLCSRRVAGWKLSLSLGAPLVEQAFERAVKLWSVSPSLHHSDRGVQYASCSFRKLLSFYQITPSMSRKACCYDNATMESFFATLKTECFHDQIPLNLEHAQRMLFDYIETFYNPTRLHSSLGYLSPIEFENSLYLSTQPPNI
jgi:putative transposase